MKATISTLPKRDTYGKKLYAPQCQITKAVAAVRRSTNVSGEVVECLAKHGFEIEYYGQDDQWLNDLGAKKIAEKKTK